MTPPLYNTLITDLAKHLHGLGIGQWQDNGEYDTYRPPAIYWGFIPEEADYGIGINIYADSDLRDDDTRDLYVQIRARGNKHPATPGQILDRIYQALHNQTHYQLNNATNVLLSKRHLRTEEEPDKNMRWTRADSWTFTLNP